MLLASATPSVKQKGGALWPDVTAIFDAATCSVSQVGRTPNGHGCAMQETVGKMVNEDSEGRRGGSQFDPLFADGDMVHIGQMRAERDAPPDMPRLIQPSVQVTLRTGPLPPAEDNGVSHLKVPINIL